MIGDISITKPVPVVPNVPVVQAVETGKIVFLDTFL